MSARCRSFRHLGVAASVVVIASATAGCSAPLATATPSASPLMWLQPSDPDSHPTLRPLSTPGPTPTRQPTPTWDAAQVKSACRIIGAVGTAHTAYSGMLTDLKARRWASAEDEAGAVVYGITFAQNDFSDLGVDMLGIKQSKWKEVDTLWSYASMWSSEADAVQMHLAAGDHQAALNDVALPLPPAAMSLDQAVSLLLARVGTCPAGSV